MHKVTGRFVQKDYGFSVKAPATTPGYVTNGGEANHGMIIILGKHRKIAVYPEYILPEIGNKRPCHRDQFPWEPNSKNETGTIVLGNRKACLETFTTDNNVWSVAQTTGDDRGQGMMYTLLLTTTQQSFQADMASLRSVAASFRRVPIKP